MLTRFGQAVQRLELGFGRGAVRVALGPAAWLCSSSAFAAARDELAKLPTIPDQDGRAGEVLAYDELRRLVGGPILSLGGGPERGSSGARRVLAARAVAAGLLADSLEVASAA